MYSEIFRLGQMLVEANIPFEIRTCHGGYQIGYPKLPPKECICDVIEHDFSYGCKEDKLEIMGLLTPEESRHDSVLGFLTAENVFQRIKKHYEENK